MNSTDSVTTTRSENATLSVEVVHLLARLVRSFRGMTLIELIIGLAIASLISGAALVSIHQILTASALANDTQVAVSQVRSAEHWMARDILTTQDVAYGVDSGFPLSLTWTDIDGGNHMIQYSLNAMPVGSLYELEREYTNPDGQVSAVVVASQIDTSLTSAMVTTAGSVRVTIVATARSQTAERAFEATPRSD